MCTVSIFFFFFFFFTTRYKERTLLKGQCHDIQWFFCALLREQKMAAACASIADISSVSRANSFTAQTKSSTCRFPRLCLVAAIIFPHTKWLPKITFFFFFFLLHNAAKWRWLLGKLSCLTVEDHLLRKNKGENFLPFSCPGCPG